MIQYRPKFAGFPALAFALLLSLSLAAHAQSMVQIPFTSVAAGVPASTYNGIDSLPCNSTTSGYLDIHGDGCPATQATLLNPYGASVDAFNNIYIAEYGSYLIRVIYQGGTALAAALVAANPSLHFTPTVGAIYPLGGATAKLKVSNGNYYCTGTGGTVALDAYGNGCPAQYAYIRPRNVAIDAAGNIFVTNLTQWHGILVIYVGGAAAAQLITAYNPSVTAPKPGYVYSISGNNDFVSIRDVAIDSNENVYASDNGALTSETGLQANTSGNQIKKFTGTGWTTYLTYSTSDTPTGTDGDGGSVAAANVSGPNSLFFDLNNNLYIDDASNSRIRVVYNSGRTPPLYVEGANSTVITNPQPASIYTVAGGAVSGASGSLAPGSLASALYLGSPPSIGMDAGGNLYFTDGSKYLWMVNAQTGVAAILGGNAASTTYGSASTSPAAGAACNGSGGGPNMTDAYADGCPATEVFPLGPVGRIAFDTAGNFYQVEARVSADSVGIVRKYSYANQFGSVAVGSTATLPLAFTPAGSTIYSPSPTSNYLITGDATAEFGDAGNDNCSTYATTSVQTCVFNAGFKPGLAGQRLGALALAASGTPLGSFYLGGIGTGAQLSLDPSTQTTIGSGLAPSGVGIDQGNNFYISDSITGNVYKSSAGASPALFASGFKNPAQVAVDGAGTVYIADPGNNRIASVNSAGVVSTFLSTYDSTTLSGPNGVAVDLAGNVYVADTGNNRVLQVSSAGAVSVKPFSGLNSPRGIAVDAAGDIFVADTNNSQIVELTAAGVQSPIPVSPALSAPAGVAVDPAGDLYIVDSGNLNVIEISTGTTAATSLLGNTSGLTGIAADSTGDVFIAGSGLGGVLELNRTQITVVYPDTNAGQASTQVLTLNNSGNAALTLGTQLSSGSGNTADFSVASATTNGCTTNEVVTSGQNCAVSATFQPAATGSFQDAVTFPSTAANSATALLTGNGVQKINSTTVLSYTTTTGGVPLAGQAFIVTATITPATNVGAVSGTVTFAVDGSAQSPVIVSNGVASVSLTLPVGAHTITALYSGDTNYVASTATLSITAVTPAATALALAVSSIGTPENLVPFTVTAMLSSTASQGAIGGTVTFTVDGTPQAPVTIVGSAASITLTLKKGSHTITATYSGSSYYLTSAKTLIVSVVASGTSSVALSLTSPAGAITYGQSVTVTAAITTGNATTTPTGTVTFALDGVTQSTVAYASSLSVTLLPLAGSHTITATYSGDDSYAPSTGSLAITVAKATPAIAFKVTPNVSTSGNSLTLTATVSSVLTMPTGTATFSYGGTSLGTTAFINGTAVFTTTTNILSSYALTAAYGGDANFLSVAITTTPTADFLLSSVNPSVTIPQGGVAVAYLNVNSFYGYTGNIQVSCTGLPTNAVCRGTPSITTVAADTIQSLPLQIITNVSPTVAGFVPPCGRNGRFDAMAIAFCFALGIPLWVYRRRCKGITLLVLLFVAAISFSGCGSDTHQTASYITPTGTYSITVSATDGTNIHATTVSLTVLAATT
ncbi:MAG TPA: Ig-like domain repeat protein [Acidobacteriaceae bacterium]